MNKKRFFELANKYKLTGDHLSPKEQKLIESFADELFPEEKLTISSDFFNKLTNSTLFKSFSQQQVNFINDVLNEAIKQKISKKKLAEILAILYWNHKFRAVKYNIEKIISQTELSEKQTNRISHLIRIFSYCINK